MYSDPIADMLTRIRNAYLANKKDLVLPFSNLKKAIAEVLVAEKYLTKVEEVKDGKKKDLKIELLYKNNKPAITKIERISKASIKVYQKKDELPYVLSGRGHAIITTSKGVMTARQARKKSLGGEIICKVY